MKRQHTPVKALIRSNSRQPGRRRGWLLLTVVCFALGAGGCGSGPARAPVTDRTAQDQVREPARGLPAPAPPRPETYVVKKGDTLYSIALDHGLDHKELARWNNIQEGRILAGQELRLSPPAGAAVVTPAPAGESIQARPLDGSGASVPGGLRTTPKALKLPYSEENVALLQHRGNVPPAPATPAPGEAPPPAEKPEAQAKAPASGPGDTGNGKGIQWIWPAKGKLLAGFNGASNKGIDIDGKSGDPVLAAAAGKVIHSGVGPRGFGNLVIIKHSESYISAYAHNDKLLVKEGEMVRKGQKIAEMGSSDADRVKLHFEIRIHGVPQDPVKLLPDRS